MEAIKGKVTYVEPDILGIEKDFIGKWRVHNGDYFTGGFASREKALKFAKKNNGTKIGYLDYHNGTMFYWKVERVDINESE